MRNSAITNIQANYTQHPYTAQTAGHMYMRTPIERTRRTHRETHTYVQETRIHADTRAAAAASILCPRPLSRSSQILQPDNMPDNVIHAVIS